MFIGNNSIISKSIVQHRLSLNLVLKNIPNIIDSKKELRIFYYLYLRSQ